MQKPVQKPGLALATLLALASCSTDPHEPAAPEPSRRWGELMREVGSRFERAGRAGRAGSWELAEYDLHEIDEVFEDDVPNARVPHDVAIDLRSVAGTLASGPLVELRAAAGAHDAARFATAFGAVSESCNACHRAAGRSFVVVPSTPGDAVPVID